MKKIYMFIFIIFLPAYLFSQFVIEPGYQVTFQVKPSTVNRLDSVGIFTVKAGFDINKNGKKEILLLSDPNLSGGSTQDTSSTLFLLENDGKDNYKLIWSYKIPYSTKWTSYRGYGDIDVADVDKDGNMEIWVVLPTLVVPNDANRMNPPRIFVFEYANGSLPNKPTATWDLGVRDNMAIRPFNIILDDVDGDGDIEIVSESRRDDYTSTTFDKGSGRTLIVGSLVIGIEMDGLNVFTQEYIDTNSYLKGGALYDTKVVDYDKDGKKEIWVFTWDKLSINIFEATAPNTYSHVAEVRQAFPIEYGQPQGDLGSMNGASFYDVNGDGKLECYISCMSGENPGEDGAVVYITSVDDVSKLDKSKMVPSGDYSKYIKMLGYRNGNPHGSTFGDFDKDGKADFIFVDRKYDRMVKMEYNGIGDLGDSTSYTWTTLYQDTSYITPDYLNCTSTADMDGDGFPEIILANLDVKSPSRPMALVIEATKVGSVKKIDGLMPEVFSLQQNYPNPFNPSTKIEFAIPKASKVTLKVYDIIGKEITTLVDREMEPGSYVTNFDASNLPSGTYFYTLQAGDYTSKMKMMLVK